MIKKRLFPGFVGVFLMLLPSVTMGQKIKYEFSLYYPVYKFFDASPVLLKPNVRDYSKYLLSIGLSHRVFINNRVQLGFSHEEFVAIYEASIPPFIQERSMRLYTLHFNYLLAESKRIEWECAIYPIWRKGVEFQIRDYNTWDQNFSLFRLNDFGLASGILLKFKFLDYAYVFMEPRYTQILWRASKDDPNFHYSSGSTRNFLSLNWGLGIKLDGSKNKLF